MTTTIRTLLRISDVEQIVKLKRSTIYALIQRNEFPKQIKLSARASAWDSCAVQRWIDERIGFGRNDESEKGRAA